MCPQAHHAWLHWLSPSHCHPLLGTSLHRRASRSQAGAMVGTGAFAAAPVPAVSQGVPSQGWGGTAVTGCHQLLLFPQGLEFRALACHRSFQVPSPAPWHAPGAHLGVRLARGATHSPRSTGTRSQPGGDPGDCAEPGGAQRGCGAEQRGCRWAPAGAEGFPLLSGGVAGQLGFGGECPSPEWGIFGVCGGA